MDSENIGCWMGKPYLAVPEKWVQTTPPMPAGEGYNCPPPLPLQLVVRLFRCRFSKPSQCRISGGQNPPDAPDFGPAPPVNNVAPLLQRLGPLPFWRGEERFLATMNMVCVRAASRGWTVWSGECLERMHPATPKQAADLRPMRRRLHMDLTMR